MMTKATSRVFLAAAAASLALTPMAAQANTRAADANVCYVCSAAQTSADSDRDERFRVRRGFRGFRIILGIAAFSALVAAIVAASQQGNQSPGT